MASDAVLPELSGLKPIERQPVAEQVAHRLLALVQSRSLEPGDQIPPERELAAAMSVSRPSVREALRALSILGVINIRQGGGAFVSSLDATQLLEPLQFFITLDRSNVRELYDARMLIESGIARRAARRISEEQIASLHAMLGPQAKLVRDPVGFRVSDLQFHQTIIDAAANPFLERVALSLNVLGMEYRRIASETPGVLEQSVKDHAAIAAALETHDPDGAAAAMEAHMENVRRTTDQAMRATR